MINIKRLIFITSILLSAAVLSISIIAAESGFSPSVEAKTTPEISTAVTSSGVDLKEVMEVVSLSEALSLNSVSSNSSLTPEENQKVVNILTAYNEILEAESLTDLGIDISASYSGVKAEDIVIRDMIDLSLKAGAADIKKEGETIQITVDLKVKPTDTVVVMIRDENGQWSLLDPKYIVINNDGTIKITLEKVGVVAFGVSGKTTPKIQIPGNRTLTKKKTP